MATIRILAIVCAALFAGLTLTLGSAALAPAVAQTAAEAPPGRPLNLVPQLGKAKKFSKQARKLSGGVQPKTIHRVAQRRRAPARAFVRRQNSPAVASRQNDSVVMPDQDSLGYQAESKTQPPIDAWLRAPLPAAAAVPTATRRPAATARNQIDTTAETVTLGAPTADALPTDTATADLTTTDLATTDTVQVADAGEINEIDLAADDTPALAVNATPAPANKSWLNSLLAVLGGAFAAAAAASFLFARRRKPLRLSF